MQDNKIKIIIIILIVLIFLVGIGGTVLYFTTDMLKSSKILFQKYIAQDMQNIVDVFEVSKEEQNIDLLRKSDYKEATNATLKYLEKENDEQEVYTIKEEGINKAQENSSYRNISMSYGDNVLMSVDLLSQNNTYGFRLANLVQQFVSVQNATVPYFVSSMGLDGSIFQETLKGVDVAGLLDFSDEEVEQLTNTYMSVVLKDLDKAHYSSKRNSIITLNNKESVTTNAYTLTITKNELDKLYKKLLNQAINDNIILAKLDSIDSKIKEAGFKEAEGKSLKEQYISNLKEIVDGLEYQGEDSRKISVTVYEQKGRTVRTLIKTENAEYEIDLDSSNGKKLSLKTTEITGEEKKIKLYTLGKTDNEQGRNREFSYSDENQNLEVALNTVQTDSEIAVDTNVNYKSTDITSIDFTSKTQIELSANEAIPVNFDETNNILLNNYEGDRILSILDSLKNRAIASLEQSQSIINTKLLNNIILKIDEKEQKQQQQEKDDEELKKEKFNNKFILYEGENVEQEYVQKLIKTVSENMEDYQVVSGTQIKILIKEGVKNEQKANEILTAIDSSKNTFNIKLNYDEQGYVNSIDITVYEKK
jgi:6-pyruvoyl-tetrahydropterin synthase